MTSILFIGTPDKVEDGRCGGLQVDGHRAYLCGRVASVQEPDVQYKAWPCGGSGKFGKFPFKKNLFVVIVDKYVFYPQQLGKSSNLQQVRSRSLSTSITAV